MLTNKSLALAWGPNFSTSNFPESGVPVPCGWGGGFGVALDVLLSRY
jgi:hypothetical protein